MRKNPVFSDDPQAIEKLQSELAELERQQTLMKTANAAIRRDDRPALEKLGLSPKVIAKLFTPDFCGDLGFPKYLTTNNSSNMRRIRERIERLTRAAASPPGTQATHDAQLSA